MELMAQGAELEPGPRCRSQWVIAGDQQHEHLRAPGAPAAQQAGADLDRVDRAMEGGGPEPELGRVLPPCRRVSRSRERYRRRMDLSAARVLITGASRGIGLEIARRLHAKGATIIGTARSEASLQAAVDELDMTPIVGDLNDPAVADGLIDEALSHGPIDVLVNNAGIEIVGQVAEQDPGDLRSVIGVNLEVPITLTRHVLPHLLERGSGRIVNISSMASVVSTPGWATYSASKAGLSSFSRSLRSELAGTGVGVTIVEIGFVQTDMLDDLRGNDFVEASFKRYKSLGLARIMEVDEVADAISKAIAKDRGHVRLPKRSIGLSLIANGPRSFAEFVQRGVPTK